MPTGPLPRHPTPPKSAFQQISVQRLARPDNALRPPETGQAQVVFRCEYDEWSPQYESNLHTPNPPAGQLRRHRSGDLLASRPAVRMGLALGNHGDPVSDGYTAAVQSDDSWPTRTMVTAFFVERRNLTRANLVEARNWFADACSVKDGPPVLSGVRVGIYAGWSWRI